MKVLLLVPKRYSLYESFEDIFAKGYSDIETHGIDYLDNVKKWEQRVHAQNYRVPDKWRIKWEAYYFKKINNYYQEQFDRLKPDLVLVYNSEMLTPETVAYFKTNGAKIAFFLGDSPFYTYANRYYLSLLFLADGVYVPDTFWQHQLAKLGIKNIHFFQTDIPSDQYFEKDLTAEQQQALGTEVFYIGTSYSSSWGYKKARFLNHFTGYDLKIRGNKHWKKFFRFFPDLEPHFQEQNEYLPVETVNDYYNATCIVPVDGNPGILNGLHARVWEALGSGALPLMEWQQDLEEIFGKDADLPAVRSYDEIEEQAAYYINNPQQRREKVVWMRDLLNEKYSPQNNWDLLQNTLQL